MTTSTPSNSDQHDNNIFDGSNTAQLHYKKSQEKYIANPDELPIVEEVVWTIGTSSTTIATYTNDVVAATGASVPTVDNTTEINQQQDNNDDDAITVDPNLEEISRVNEAPHDNINDESSSTSIHNENALQQQQQQHNTTTNTIPACESYHQKLTSFGSHSSKNRGVIVRYRYEVVQDLTGMMDGNNDTTQQYWTMNSRGERDNIVYLVESILPEIELKIVDDVMVPMLFDECSNSSSDSKKRVMIRRLSSSDDVIGMDMKPDDFPLPQSECTSDYTPEDRMTMSQCHPIEGAMTLYFQDTIPRSSTITSAITLQTLNAIKEAMENGLLLSSLNSSVLSLTFLDSSYSLSSASSQLDAAETDDTSGNSSKSNPGLIAGLTMVFLALGILMFILFFVVCKNYKNDDRMEQRDMVGIEVSVDTNLEDTTTREEDKKKDLSSEPTNYHSERIDRFYASRGSNYSEFSSDSEAHDSVYMSEGESPGYSNNIFYKTNQAGAAYGNSVIADGTEDNGYVVRPVS